MFKILRNILLPNERYLIKSMLRQSYSSDVGANKKSSYEKLHRFDFHKDSEDQLNEQIKTELYASNVYLTMANHFARTDVALRGAVGFFLTQCEDERNHAFKLMKFQNMRGGHVKIPDICQFDNDICLLCPSLLTAFKNAIQLERDNTTSLMKLYRIAEQHNDVSLLDLMTEFCEEQMNALRELGCLITRLKQTGNKDLGIYLFDRELERKYPYSGNSIF